MTPFQIVVLAVLVVIALLLGTLVVYGSVLIGKIRSASATMRRIEEALISKGGPLVSANTRPAEAVGNPEVSSKQVEATRYLTVRDLKNRDEPRSPRAAARNTLKANLTSRDEPVASREQLKPSADDIDSVDVAAVNLASNDSSDTDDERANVLPSPVENEIISAHLVSSTAPTNNAAQLPTSPDARPVNGDALEKKDQDALLIMLSSQRRRRRARQGY